MEEMIGGWLTQSLAGRLFIQEMAHMIQETLILEGLITIKARILGDDMILISREEWLGSIFESLVSWSPDAANVPRHWLVWVKLYVVSLHLWRKECLIKIVAPVGNIVEIDENIEKFSRLEFARLKIKTSSLELITHFRKIPINDILYGLRLMDRGDGRA